MTVEARLAALGIALPDPPRPAGRYRPWAIARDLLFVSGQVPLENGVLRHPGRVGAELSEADGYRAARLAALNVLAQIRAALGGFARLAGIVRLEGHVASAPGWTNQPGVLDGASDLFAEVLGDASHARAAFGPAQLPLGASVELVVVAAIMPAGTRRRLVGGSAGEPRSPRR